MGEEVEFLTGEFVYKNNIDEELCKQLILVALWRERIKRQGINFPHIYQSLVFVRQSFLHFLGNKMGILEETLPKRYNTIYKKLTSFIT